MGLENPMQVAVIGAGAAGLCAAHHLSLESDKFRFDVYEQQDQVGGTWCYNSKVGLDDYGLQIHSSMYKNLRTNLPKEVMAFPGFPFPDDSDKSFLHHSDVLQYLEKYAQHYDLYKFIKFHTIVENVVPIKLPEDKVKWTVSVRNLVTSEKGEYDYDAVMVCNGHYSVPYIPELKGLDAFQGVLLHSHDYRDSSMFKDKKVVILGAGASGIDIAIEVSASAKEVVMSHNLPVRTCPLPANLLQEKGIESFSKSSVTFVNGTIYKCDAVIVCTGYLYTYPFLHSDCNIDIGDQKVAPLFKHLFHIEFPTLAIWAVPKQIIPFPIYNQQVLVYLKFLKGLIKLPSEDEMRADTENDLKQRLDRGMKPRHAHTMPGNLQWEYDDELSEIGKIPPIPEVIRNIFRHVHSKRKQDVLNYKNCSFKIISDTEFIEVK